MHGWREDHDGFFCGRCGRATHMDGEPCEPPVYSSDLDWSVIAQTLLDSLRFDDSEQPRVCRFNQATRQRAHAALVAYLSDSARRTRLQYSMEA